MQLQIDTKPLLRPTQLANAQEERANMEYKLRSPHIEDKGTVRRQLKRLEESLAVQTPKAFIDKEKDAAVRLEADLRDKILEGMLSQEEMRKNPPDAVARHMAWEKANKSRIQQWKNLKLRMNVGNDDDSVANFEIHRPVTGTMNMDNAQIQGKMFFMPPDGAKRGVAFTDEQLAILELVSPGLRDRLALLNNEQRAEVKAALSSAPEAEEI